MRFEHEAISKVMLISKRRSLLSKLICPNCNDDISLINYMVSLAPSRIKCNNCGSKLILEKYTNHFIAVVAFLGLLFGIIASVLKIPTWSIDFFLYVIILATLFEVTSYYAARLLRIKLIVKE